MSKIFEAILSTAFLEVAAIYGWHRLSETSVIFKNYKLYVVYITSIFTCVAYSFLPSIYVKLLLLLMTGTILHRFLFKTSIKESFICVIETQIIILILEFLCMLFLLTVLNIDITTLQKSLFLNLAPNFIIGALLYIVFLSKVPILIKNSIINFIENLSTKFVMVFLIILMITINLVMGIAYYETTTLTVIIVEVILLILYTVISILMLKEKNTSEQYKLQNVAQGEVLKNYVEMLDQQCILNHENENQLQIIEELAKRNDTKSIIEYIDTTLGEKRTDDDTLLRRVKRIPLATLQGLIYQKLLLMKQEKIEFKLVLPRSLKVIDFTKLDMKTIIELCKVVGVFLDNAIEEVRKLENKSITVELRLKQDDMYIHVINNYGTLLDNMDQNGTTSKDGVHGYGLGVVADIIKKNKRIRNERTILGNKFQQTVIISDMKTKKKKNS